MKKENQMLIPQKNKAEAEELLKVLNTMTQEDQKQMLAFLSGVSLGRRLSTGPAA